MFGWWNMGMDLSMLAMESQVVVVQRVTLMAMGGPAAQGEAQEVVTEKMAAAGEAAMQVATGAANGEVVISYRRTVRAHSLRRSRR
ncbi:hypothetical protein MKK53_03155 [Methylobacterium sp. J-076]|nr:hypothetical protein [Methylobacterium sp. J-076]